MARLPEARALANRLLAVLAITFLLVAAGVILLVHHHLRERALAEAESKAHMLLNQNLAIHTYFNRDLKPGLFAADSVRTASDHFDPHWMSSTFAVRKIREYAEDISETPYSYRECAINARSPLNEADAYEREFIQELNRDPHLVSRSEMRKIDGQRYLVTISRGEQMIDACLRCHSGPGQAPADLVALYGEQRSFNREIGEWVSAISIRIPLEEAYAAVNRISLQLSLALLAVLLGVFVLHFWLGQRLLARPLEQLVWHRTAALEESQQEMETFGYAVSHSLRSPLRHIDGYCHMALTEYGDQLGEEGRGLLDQTRSAAQRMGLLIDHAQTLIRIGRGPLVVEEVDLGGIARAGFDALAEREPDRQVRFVVGAHLMAHGNPRLLTLALDALVGNAWKSNATRIEIGCARQVEERVFYIRDNGMGFDMAYAAQLFRPLGRLHGDEDFPGAGFGLATVERVVRRHHGRIWAEGEPGRGATFYFTLNVGTPSSKGKYHSSEVAA